MGAKTGILAFADGDPIPVLRLRPATDPGRARALAERLHPGYRIEPGDGDNLWEGCYPPDDTLYALSVPGLDLACDKRFMLDRPSRLPPHLLRLGAGRRVLLHAMHSGSDWLAFAVWENGALVRSLSLSPDGGIGENIGDPMPFEVPYWAGEHPVGPGPYPLPFHPLEMGEEALRHMFGFVVEGRRRTDDVPADEIRLPGFRVTDPTGAEQAGREALRVAARRMTRRSFTYRGGELVEVGLDEPGPPAVS
ncbi:hypothetical protein ABZS66_31090 [Dactylosporangium sp. NPDC005572]|uniref:DUF6928 family protein n=1 Tax=Dactylosporangium sp. NPDC005572 TaxID=3156889 RepID=UPI0033A4C918